MARARVNLIVGAGSVATLAASLTGVALADGYSLDDLVHGRAAVEAPLVAAEDSAAGGATGALQLPELSSPALAPLPDITLTPLRALEIGAIPEVRVSGDDAAVTPLTQRATVDVSSLIPSPPTTQPAQVVTVQAPPATGPALVQAPAPPPAPPPPTRTSRAS